MTCQRRRYGRERAGSRIADGLAQPFWWLIMHSAAGDGHAGGVLKVWTWWERRYLRRHHVRSLGDRSVLQVEVHRHRGATVTLSDGTAVRAGDRIVELHLANATVAPGAEAAGWSPFQVLMSARRDLASLARLVTAGSLGPVAAVHGVSLVAPALARLGFDVTPLCRTPGIRLLHFYLVGLLAVYHPEGWKAASRARDGAWPAEAWMSVERLATLS